MIGIGRRLYYNSFKGLIGAATQGLTGKQMVLQRQLGILIDKYLYGAVAYRVHTGKQVWCCSIRNQRVGSQVGRYCSIGGQQVSRCGAAVQGINRQVGGAAIQGINRQVDGGAALRILANKQIVVQHVGLIDKVDGATVLGLTGKQMVLQRKELTGRQVVLQHQGYNGQVVGQVVLYNTGVNRWVVGAAA